jgi:adenosylcobinamide-phosphate synthase
MRLPERSDASAGMIAGPVIVAGALAVEAAVGYPAALFRAIGHPVTWIGAAIAALDRRLNRADLPEGARRLRGVAAVALLMAAPLAAWGVQAAIGAGAAGLLALGVLASSLLAQRSLHDHVADVARALSADGLAGGLAGGRAAVARIVGRDPATLDAAGVARAAIESLAENFSDGVVAPALWCAVLGLPGIVFYKAVNTADSMIGHRTPRHAAFGWAAARLDDVVNLPASRCAAALLAAAAWSGGAARAVRRDARRHRSPNAGWPEAAMAGALGLRLAGPRVYGGVRVDDAWMGDGTPEAGVHDIARALAVFRAACLIQFALYAGAALLIARG